MPVQITSLCGCVCVVWLVAVAAGAATDDIDLPPSHSVAPSLYATGFQYAEGPALDARGNLYVVNYRGTGNIGRITADGTASIFCRLSDVADDEVRIPRANGLKVDAAGRLIVADAGAGRLLRVAPDGKSAEVLSQRHAGARYKAIDDVAVDLEGNIYFSDAGDSDSERPTGAIYRYDVHTKKAVRLDDGLAFPNGVAVSPNQQWLCVAESRRGRVLTYEVAEEGTVANKRILINFPKRDRGKILGGDFQPGGMVFDALGRLYVAMYGGGVINVVSVPEGEIVRQYHAGGTGVTNCHFFGPFLYTSVASKEAVFRLRIGVKGFEYNGPQ